MAEKCCCNKFVMSFFGEEKMKTREYKRMAKLFPSIMLRYSFTKM